MCITYKIITLDNYITNIPTPVLSIILAVKTRCICIKKKLLNISAKDILKRKRRVRDCIWRHWLTCYTDSDNPFGIFKLF
jgi:hypothetical protein